MDSACRHQSKSKCWWEGAGAGSERGSGGWELKTAVEHLGAEAVGAGRKAQEEAIF